MMGRGIYDENLALGFFPNNNCVAIGIGILHSSSSSLVLLHHDARSSWYKLSPSQPWSRYSRHFLPKPYSTKEPHDESFTDIIRVSTSLTSPSFILMENSSVPIESPPVIRIPTSLSARFSYFLSLCPEAPYIAQEIEISLSITNLVSDNNNNSMITT